MFRVQQLSQQICSNQCSNAVVPKVTVELAEDGKIGIINLQSPKDLNVLSQQLQDELLAAVKQLGSSSTVKVIVLLSTVPKAFCAGADISRFPKLSLETELISSTFEPFYNILFQISKPFIAGVNGFCLGGGLEVALSADVVFCSNDAKFGFPEIKLGLIPGIGGTQRLAKIAGKVNANRYILSGQFFGAAEAKAMGIVTDVIASDKLRETVLAYAKDVAQFSAYSLITAKKAVNKSEDLGITEGINYERNAFATLFNLPGSKEGISAFLNKRKPNFDKI